MDAGMSTAIIADDEPRLAANLADRLRLMWPQLDIVAVVDNGIAAAGVIADLKPTFAFLDIRMPGLDGVQVAKLAGHTRIVFVTAHDQYAVKAFESAAIDYLLKPVSDARLAQCVARLRQQGAPPIDSAAMTTLLSAPPSSPRLEWLTVRLADTTRIVAVDEVLYFRSTDKYTEAVTASDRHLIRTSLKELLEQLNPQRFTQIHRSIVINLGAVERIERDVLGRSQVHLKQHGDVLPLSRGFAERFKQM
jgi:DNA-binding LytR/AlgR family response regulator